MQDIAFWIYKNDCAVVTRSEPKAIRKALWGAGAAMWRVFVTGNKDVVPLFASFYVQKTQFEHVPETIIIVFEECLQMIVVVAAIVRSDRGQ